MPWKKARKLIKEDPRYKNFGQHDHVRHLVKSIRHINWFTRSFVYWLFVCLFVCLSYREGKWSMTGT